MSKRKSIVKLISILGFLFYLTSCIKSSEKNIKIISKDIIRGHIYIGKNSYATDYSLKDNFISLIKPDSGIWNKVIIENLKKEIKPDLFYHQGNVNYNFIYDSLNIGECNFKFISDFKDTINQQIKFSKSIELSFPSKLNEFYNKKKINDFDINKLKNNDTLQFVYKNKGCFGSYLTLIEFFLMRKMNLILEKTLIPKIKKNNGIIQKTKTIKKI